MPWRRINRVARTAVAEHVQNAEQRVGVERANAEGRAVEVGILVWAVRAGILIDDVHAAVKAQHVADSRRGHAHKVVGSGVDRAIDPVRLKCPAKVAAKGNTAVGGVASSRNKARYAFALAVGTFDVVLIAEPIVQISGAGAVVRIKAQSTHVGQAGDCRVVASRRLVRDYTRFARCCKGSSASLCWFPQARHCTVKSIVRLTVIGLLKRLLHMSPASANPAITLAARVGLLVSKDWSPEPSVKLKRNIYLTKQALSGRIGADQGKGTNHEIRTPQIYEAIRYGRNRRGPVDEPEARTILEAIRWPDGPVCPHCGATTVTRLKPSLKRYRDGVIQCNGCRGQFTVTVGTVMQRSHITLRQWVQAFHSMCSHKKGVSALQLQRNLGLHSYQAAWYLAHRIRLAMKKDPLASKLQGIVEVDETYVGGKPRKGKQDAERQPDRQQAGPWHQEGSR